MELTVAAHANLKSVHYRQSKADEKAKLQCAFNKAGRHGFLSLSNKPVDELFESSDNTWFSATLRRPDHVLHSLLPPLKTTLYHLRKRSRGLEFSAVQ